MDRREFLFSAAAAPTALRAQLLSGPVALVTCVGRRLATVQVSCSCHDACFLR